jgi:hypothetical protein
LSKNSKRPALEAKSVSRCGDGLSRRTRFPRQQLFYFFFQKPLSGVCKERLSAPRWRGEGIYAEARKSQQLFSNKNNKHLNTLNS